MIKSYFLIILILLFVTIGYSQTKLIEFTDGQQIAIVNEQQESVSSSSKSTIKIANKTFEADFLSIGKAIKPLNNRTLSRLAIKNKKLASAIKKANTAYEIRQNNDKYYLTGFNSIKFSNNECNSESCKVTIEAILINIKSKISQENVLVIKSIKKIE